MNGRHYPTPRHQLPAPPAYRRYWRIGGAVMLGALVVAGPSGLLAWGEAAQLRAERELQLAAVEAERNALAQQVALLDSAGADPDLVGELIRKNLNVVHPDEVVVMLEETAP